MGSLPPLLKINGIEIGFNGRDGNFLEVLRNVNLTLYKGESIGIVGESGSGKSTLALAAMGYLKHGLRLSKGSVNFDDQPLFELNQSKLQKIWGGRLALVPQNSGQSLTPTMRVGEQIIESLKLHTATAPKDYWSAVKRLLKQVRLPEPDTIMHRFPHELSGGQQQRVAIAMALSGEPDALLLDEPTTGLDVTTQAHILELLRDISSSKGMAMIYVSHDLGAIARVCERVIVMYAGESVLEGETRKILKTPSHPYARSLLASIPKLSSDGFPAALDGRPPAPSGTRTQCAFSDRCGIVQSRCFSEHPKLQKLTNGERCRCHFPELVEKIPLSSLVPKPSDIIGKSKPALNLNTLSITYEKIGIFGYIFGNKYRNPPTVDDITLSVGVGETLGLVGESGSGKSTILKSIAGLKPLKSGDISLRDGSNLPVDVEKRNSEQLRRIQLIFQNPDESLNPRHTVVEILAQPLRLYFGLTGKTLRDRAILILEKVRLSEEYLDRYPSQLSGGEKQRVAIARAFIAEPEVVLCDEVTSALDVSVQAAVLELLNDLKRLNNTTYIFVSHDLAVVKALSDRVAVLYQGRLCELGSTKNVFSGPSHPYTEVLLGAVLEPDPDMILNLVADDTVELGPPALGCPFQRRCPRKLGSICEEMTPPERLLEVNHTILCHISVEDL